MIHSCLVCVCSLGIFSLSLLQQHRSEFRLTPTPWFWFVCAICDLTGLFGDDWQGWKWGLTSDLLRIDIESGKLQQWQRRITGRRSAWGPVISFERFVGSFTGFKVQGWSSYVLCRLCWRRMKTMAIFFLHDGSYGCSYLIAWLVGVNSTISCSRRIDTYIFRKLSSSFWKVHNRKDFKHNASRPFGHSTSANFAIWR